jgi:opacity protein-like surface antigen
MKRILMVAVVVVMLMLAALPALAEEANDSACWGQASAVFAQMGAMGEHSSSFETPRLGLRNLARFLYEHEPDKISDDTMQALGAYVAAELGLSIDACN